MADISDAGAEARVGHSRWCQIDPKSPGDSRKMLDDVKQAESTNSGLLASGSLALRVAIAIFRSSTAICSQQNHGQKLMTEHSAFIAFRPLKGDRRVSRQGNRCP